jgi:hypothetical protein
MYAIKRDTSSLKYAANNLATAFEAAREARYRPGSRQMLALAEAEDLWRQAKDVVTV